MSKTHSQWEKELGLKRGVIWQRKNTYKWSDKECLLGRKDGCN